MENEANNGNAERFIGADQSHHRRSMEYLLIGLFFPVFSVYLLILFSEFIENVQLAVQVLLLGLVVGSAVGFLIAKRELHALETKGQVKITIWLVAVPLILFPSFLNPVVLFFTLPMLISYAIIYVSLNLRWEKKFNSYQYSKGYWVFTLPK